MTKLKPMKVVMTEVINDYGNWEWTELSRLDTPRQAIKNYLIDYGLIKEGDKVTFIKDGTSGYGQDAIFAKDHDVRAFYITIWTRTMTKKAFYIYSFYSNDELDYDWFVGKDFEKYDEQEMEVANHMVENDYGDNYEEALEMLKDVYKQDTKLLIEKLK